MEKATEITNVNGTVIDTIELSYDDRFRRRMVMTALSGMRFMLDLPKAQELNDGAFIKLENGSLILIKAADEPLMKVKATDKTHLARLSWHIGNRHLACEISEMAITLRYDHVIEAMVIQLGAEVTKTHGPFNPEGGAYGHGRTHSHEH